jgi:predicted amidohydrolase YtcJ
MATRRSSNITRVARASGAMAALLAFALPASAEQAVYFGGDILTMAGARPAYVEALVVKDGKIDFAGRKADALERAGAEAKRIDLMGKTLLPGFIDAHGHIVDYTLRWVAPDLSPPPVGDVTSIADIQGKIAKFIVDTKATPDTLILSQGYDDGLIAEKRHPVRADLDTISADIPIVVIHSSGHLVVANSAALKKVGYTKDTKDPPGGVIRRDANGEPNGVLEEKAAYAILPLVKPPAPAEQMRYFEEIQAWYASLGVTTAQDGISSPANIAFLREASRQDKLILDIVSYPMWTLFEKVMSGEQKLDNVEIYPPGSMANAGRGLASDAPTTAKPDLDTAKAKIKIGLYEGHYKIGGVKLSADGSPQGKTAYMTKPYVHPPEGQPRDYRAYPVIEQPEMDRWFEASYKYNVPLLVHVNGDAAIDVLIASVEKARAKHGAKDMRPVAIHAQFARHDQIDRMKKLGIFPSFFSAHAYFWGDWHINETMGKDRAFGLSPMAYAGSKDVKFSNHTDSPVVPPDMLMLTWTAVNRLSRTGVIVGPNERATPYVALKALTDWAAWQYFEEKTKGTLEAGKRADMVVLLSNPLRVDPAAIKDISVIETIKDGKTIYRASETGVKWAPRRPKIPFVGAAQ